VIDAQTGQARCIRIGFDDDLCHDSSSSSIYLLCIAGPVPG
jgi:hypothetical protein